MRYVCLVGNVTQLDSEHLNQEIFVYESKIIVYEPFKIICKAFVQIVKLPVFQNNINSNKQSENVITRNWYIHWFDLLYIIQDIYVLNNSFLRIDMKFNTCLTCWGVNLICPRYLYFLFLNGLELECMWHSCNN